MARGRRKAQKARRAPRTATGIEADNATTGDAGTADAATGATRRSEQVAQVVDAYFVDVPAGPMTKPGTRAARWSTRGGRSGMNRETPSLPLG
jgi:hypothetical protein